MRQENFCTRLESPPAGCADSGGSPILKFPNEILTDDLKAELACCDKSDFAKRRGADCVYFVRCLKEPRKKPIHFHLGNVYSCDKLAYTRAAAGYRITINLLSTYMPRPDARRLQRAYAEVLVTGRTLSTAYTDVLSEPPTVRTINIARRGPETLVCIVRTPTVDADANRTTR